MSDQVRIEADGADTLLWVKAVPGASREGLAGVIGDRLKVRVRAAAEGGKANDAITRVIATHLGVKPRQVEVEVGATGRDKVVRVRGVGTNEVRARL